jgi:hypothetical protein
MTYNAATLKSGIVVRVSALLHLHFCWLRKRTMTGDFVLITEN